MIEDDEWTKANVRAMCFVRGINREVKIGVEGRTKTIMKSES